MAFGKTAKPREGYTAPPIKSGASPVPIRDAKPRILQEAKLAKRHDVWKRGAPRGAMR